MEQREKNTKIQAKSKMELAHAYNVSLTTLNRWLAPFKEQIGEYRGKSFTPKQVKIIFELVGEP